ncbi:MAG: KH domain-containing protein [Elusimicrobiota bacterium]
MATPTDLVASIVKLLVDDPAQVEARWVESPEGGRVEIKVPADQRGRVIGRRGRTIRALRALATAVFGKENEPVGVELTEQ